MANSTRDSMALVVHKDKSVSRSHSTHGGSSSKSRDGIETRLARLENSSGSQDKSVSRSHSTHGGSSSKSRDGIETRLARLENSSGSRSSRAEPSSAPGNKTLLRKVDQLSSQIEDMKFDARGKELQEKIKENEAKIQRAEDKLAAGRATPVIVVNSGHPLYCECYHCIGY